MSWRFKIYFQYQGDEVFDTDIPTLLEAKLFCTTLGKFCWVLLQPLFYALRPVLTYPKPPGMLEVVNVVIQLTYNFMVYYYFGGKAIFYLLGGSLLSMGCHPVAGHFISEHYMFRKGYETYSYYGILNCVTFNVGYHNEHHDLPSIPWNNLPKLRTMAPEFYDNLKYHSSWTRLLLQFIFDFEEVGEHLQS